MHCFFCLVAYAMKYCLSRKLKTCFSLRHVILVIYRTICIKQGRMYSESTSTCTYIVSPIPVINVQLQHRGTLTKLPDILTLLPLDVKLFTLQIAMKSDELFFRPTIITFWDMDQIA